jgi:hypothetical protein
LPRHLPVRLNAKLTKGMYLSTFRPPDRHAFRPPREPFDARLSAATMSRGTMNSLGTYSCRRYGRRFRTSQITHDAKKEVPAASDSNASDQGEKTTSKINGSVRSRVFLRRNKSGSS